MLLSTQSKLQIIKFVAGIMEQRISMQPLIVIDFEVEDGGMFLSISNQSAVPAMDVRVKPDTEIMGLGGRKKMVSLSMFSKITYLAPGKKIKTFVDSFESFFAHQRKMVVTFNISYRNDCNEKFTTTIKHDLKVYKDLVFFIKKI